MFSFIQQILGCELWDRGWLDWKLFLFTGDHSREKGILFSGPCQGKHVWLNTSRVNTPSMESCAK